MGEIIQSLEKIIERFEAYEQALEPQNIAEAIGAVRDLQNELRQSIANAS